MRANLNATVNGNYSVTLNRTRRVCKTRMLPATTKSKYGKNLFKSYILTPPHPQGHVMSKRDGITDRQMDGRSHY